MILAIDSFSSFNSELVKFSNPVIYDEKRKEIIYYKLDDVLDLEQISKEFNISKFQFIRMFKSNTEITPYQYFLNTKLIHTKKYLDNTKDLYATIVEFGFSDISHFNRDISKGCME